MATAYVSTLTSPERLDARTRAHGCWLQYSSARFPCWLVPLSHDIAASGLDSGSLGEYLYKRTHTAARVLLVLLSYLTNGEFFPLYFSYRIALCSLC